MAQHFKPAAIRQFGSVLLGVCHHLALDLQAADTARQAVKCEPYAAFQLAHRSLFKYAFVLVLETELSVLPQLHQLVHSCDATARQ